MLENMNKRLVKILALVLTIFITAICVGNNVMAAVGSSDITSNFNGEDEPDGTDKVRNVLSTVLVVVRTVAVGVAVVVITILGMKYMMAAPSEKADIKKQLITFTIGVVAVVGAVNTVNIIRDFATSATST